MEWSECVELNIRGVQRDWREDWVGVASPWLRHRVAADWTVVTERGVSWVVLKRDIIGWSVRSRVCPR